MGHYYINLATGNLSPSSSMGHYYINLATGNLSPSLSMEARSNGIIIEWAKTDIVLPTPSASLQSEEGQ